jgi:2-methylcitrate dehydratase PrpD
MIRIGRATGHTNEARGFHAPGTRGDGGMVKRLHLGRASEAGVLAASLAADGFAGPRTVLEGEFGFLKVFCTRPS